MIDQCGNDDVCNHRFQLHTKQSKFSPLTFLNPKQQYFHDKPVLINTESPINLKKMFLHVLEHYSFVLRSDPFNQNSSRDVKLKNPHWM